jgi:hypothetical protein
MILTNSTDRYDKSLEYNIRYSKKAKRRILQLPEICCQRIDLNCKHCWAEQKQLTCMQKPQRKRNWSLRGNYETWLEWSIVPVVQNKKNFLAEIVPSVWDRRATLRSDSGRFYGPLLRCAVRQPIMTGRNSGSLFGSRL